MILTRHAIRDPASGALCRQEELRSQDLIVVRSRQRGAVVDEGIWPGRAPGWCMARFVLDGPLVARHLHADVRPGDVLFAPAYGDAPARSLEERLDTLIVMWRSASAVGVGGAAGRPDIVRPSPLATGALVRLATSLGFEEPPLVRAAALDALEALRATGLPLSPARAIDGAIGIATEEEQAIASAIGPVLSALSTSPMAIDLARAIGVCERHALRRVNELFARYYRSAMTWRDYVYTMRLTLGTFFIGQPGATTESVARLLGFASPTSLCHAFRAAGLPSPLAVKRALRPS